MSIFSTKCLLFSYVFAILEERIWELVTVIPSSYLRGLPEESSSSMNRTSRATGSQVDEVHLIPRLREPVKSLLDNFSTILRAAKIEDESQIADNVQGEHDHQLMQVRAANMVRAGETLLRLTADIKECLILNDLSTLRQQHVERSSELDTMRQATQETLGKVQELLAADLKRLEEGIKPCCSCCDCCTASYQPGTSTASTGSSSS